VSAGSFTLASVVDRPEPQSLTPDVVGNCIAPGLMHMTILSHIRAFCRYQRRTQEREHSMRNATYSACSDRYQSPPIRTSQVLSKIFDRRTSRHINRHLAVIAILLITTTHSALATAAGNSSGQQHLSKQQLSHQLKKAIRQADAEGLKAFKLPLSHQLRKIPQDPRNKLTAAKVKLGKLLFHETALGLNPQDSALVGTYSCASCHHVAAGFKSGIPQGLGEGGSGFAKNGQSRVIANPHKAKNKFTADFQPIASPTILNTAYQETMLWNGSFGNSDGSVNNAVDPDKVNNAGPEKVFVNKFGFAGLESQAIAGTKVHRMRMRDSIIDEHGRYKRLFQQAFPRGVDGIRGDSEVDEKWLGAALAIAAYERTVLANRAPFQQWLRGNKNAMSKQQLRGGVLFFGEAGCVGCHTGPALSSKTGAEEHEIFFNVGFDQLYNLKDSPILGHGASFSTVRQVIEYKNRAKPQKKGVRRTLSDQFVKLHLTDNEIDDLVAFVEDALYDKRLSRYVPIAKQPAKLTLITQAPRLSVKCHTER